MALEKPSQNAHFPPLDALLAGVWLALGALWPQAVYPHFRVTASLALLVIFLGRFLISFRQGQFRFPASAAIALLAFPLVAGITNPFQNQSPAAGADLLGSWCQGGLLGIWALWYLAASDDPRLTMRRMLLIFGGIASLIGAYSLFNHFTSHRALAEQLEIGIANGELGLAPLYGALLDGRLRGSLGDPNHMGLLSAMGIAALLGVATDRIGNPLRALALLLTAPLLFTLALSSSRGAILGLMVGVGALILFTLALRRESLGKIKWSWVFTALLIMVALLMAVIAFSAPLRDRLSSVSTIRERLGYWQIAAEVFRMNPLLGSGTGSFALWYPKFRPEWMGTAQLVHNLPFQALAETGILGFGALLWPLYFITKQVKRESLSPALATALSVLIVFHATALTSHSPLYREIWLLGMLFTGAIMGLLVKRPVETSRATTGFVAVAALATCALIFPSDMRVARGEALLYQADLEPDRAYSLTIQSAAVNNRDDMHLIKCAQRLQSLGDPRYIRDVERLVNEAEAINPDRPSIWATRAQLLAERGAWDEALEMMERAISLNPNDWELKLEMVRHLTSARRLDEALTLAQKVIEDPRTDWRADRRLAEVHLARGEYAEAAEILGACVERSGFLPPDIALQWANLEIELGNRDEAQRILRDLIESLPPHTVFRDRARESLARALAP